MKYRKGDTVKIIAGKDAGKSGKIEKVMPRIQKVLVEGVNQYKRHKKSRMPGQKSEIITMIKPLSVANVAFVCPHCKKLTRIGYNIVGKDKVRICRKCEAVIK